MADQEDGPTTYPEVMSESNLDMTEQEREEFLADVHVGVLAIARAGKAPHALPIWYQYEDGQVVIHMDGNSVKAKLLRAAGRATMTVQTETAPYKYVSVEGPVALAQEGSDDRDRLGRLPLAVRYLGHELGQWYVDQNPTTESSVVARLTPERWITCDFGKGLA